MALICNVLSIEREKSYAFADAVRFVAMCAIIFQHSFLVDRNLLAASSSSLFFFYALKIVAKIGSISFFVVSGFLLSDALTRYSSEEYLQKRVKNIAKPYILFICFYLLLHAAGAFFGQQKIDSLAKLPLFLGDSIVTILFFTSYWFIFNYFISVLILLSLRKYLYSPILGAILLVFTLVYAVNVHVEWFLPHHTIAFFGFTFFLWLGANLKPHEARFWPWVYGTPYWKLIVITLIALAADLYETYYLIGKGATIADSSLKVTNIIYALCVLVLLCKVSKVMTFRWLNPRQETYPLYLVHPIFLKVINYAVLPLFPALSSLVVIKRPDQVTWYYILIYQVVWFFAIYGMSLLAVKFVLKTRFKWVFGK
jgi:fucose 4-O-acetylase-like acetyltransferase